MTAITAPIIVTPGQVKTGGSDAEKYEGVLVRVQDVSVADPDLGFGEWSMTDFSDTLGADDKWDYFYYPESLEVLGAVIGVMDYSFGARKIQPRLARDVKEAGGLARIQRIQQVLYSDLLVTPDDGVSDFSYMVGDTVTIEGIVTMPTGLSFAGDGIKFIYEDVNGGPWSAILSYDPDSSAFPVLLEGYHIRATGYIEEFTRNQSNMTELFITQPIEILSIGNAQPGHVAPTSATWWVIR